MVYKNFSKYDIDVEAGTVYSFCKKRQMKFREYNGYIRCHIRDDKKNVYDNFAQVVYCAVNGVTKDEFPKNPSGRLYDIDHIDGDRQNNSPLNLRLVSHADNVRNPVTRKRFSECRIGEKNSNYGRHLSEESKIGIRLTNSKKIDQIDKNTGEVVKTWNSIKDACEYGGFCRQGILCCCRGEYSHHHNFLWRRHIKNER